MAQAVRNRAQPNPGPSPRPALALPHGQGNTASPVQAEGKGLAWTRICRVDEIPRLGARLVRRLGAPNVAIFRSAGDRLFALLDRCPHRGGPLSQGIVYGERVACPLHNTAVDLESGNAVAPDKGCVRRFPVKIEEGVVYVDLRMHADVEC